MFFDGFNYQHKISKKLIRKFQVAVSVVWLQALTAKELILSWFFWIIVRFYDNLRVQLGKPILAITHLTDKLNWALAYFVFPFLQNNSTTTALLWPHFKFELFVNVTKSNNAGEDKCLTQVLIDTFNPHFKAEYCGLYSKSVERTKLQKWIFLWKISVIPQ